MEEQLTTGRNRQRPPDSSVLDLENHWWTTWDRCRFTSHIRRWPKRLRVPSETLLARTSSLDRDHAKDWTRAKAASFKKREEFERAESEYMRHFMETSQFQKDYLDKVADGLVHARESGNSYSASEKSCLSMLLETKARKGVDLSGRRGGSGNYGSGSKAKVSSWVFQEGWNEVAKKFGHSEKLQHRRPVSLTEYEHFMNPHLCLMGESLWQNRKTSSFSSM